MIFQDLNLARPWEVLGALLKWGEAKRLAHFLNLTPQAVKNWTRRPNVEGPTQTGRKSFLQYFIDTISYLYEEDDSPDRAHQLGDYICAYMDSVRVSIPAPDSEPSLEALKNINNVLKESIEAVEVTRVAWFEKSPGHFDKKEKVDAIREHLEAMQAHAQMIKWIEGA